MEKIEFPGADGVQLAGRLETPAGEVRAYAIFAHCFTCGKDVVAATTIARTLAAEGIAVLRFDFTGLGHSEGDFANTNFSSNVQDLIHAADYLRQTFAAPTILIGHSLGGAAVLVAAQHVPEVKAVITVGAPADTTHVLHHMADKQAEILATGEAEVMLGGRLMRVKKQFLEDVAQHTLLGQVNQLKVALLVMHAPLDDMVGIEHAKQIYQAAKHPKSFVSLDDADHLLSHKTQAALAARMMAAWAERYLPATV